MGAVGEFVKGGDLHKEHWTFEYFVELPAWAIGTLLGELYIFVPAAVMLAAGTLAWQVLKPVLPKPVAVIATMFITLYPGIVTYRAAHWMAFSLLEIERRSE